MEQKKLEGVARKVKTKADTDKAVSSEMDFFGNRLKVPAHIQKELDEAGLAHRFVSIKKIQESGGYHPKGWTPYTLKNPQENILTGQAEKTYRVGDLVLAVKTKEAHAQHVKYLAKQAEAQSATQRNSVKQMRDKIRESRADKHISLIEGYEENGDDDND